MKIEGGEGGWRGKKNAMCQMGYRNAILSIVSETTFNMPHSSVLYHRFTRVESGQMESNWIVSNRFRQRNVRVAARFSISIHSVFRVVVVSLFHKRGRGRGVRSIITCKRWPRRSITCRKYLGQGSQGRFPRVQSYRVRLHADVESFWNRLLLISCDSS